MVKNIFLTVVSVVLLLVVAGTGILLGIALSERGYSLPTSPITQDGNVATKESHPVGSIENQAEKQGESLVVDYYAAEHFVPLPDAKGHTKGVFYVLGEEGPAEIAYPYQSTLMVTAGNMTVNGELEFGTDGTIGNIFADVCQDEKGCSVNVDSYKAGHIGVTIVFGGYEVPNQTVADSVNTMLTGASNCGNKCLTVIVGNADGKTESFTAEVEAGSFNLKAPEAPLALVNFIFPNVPQGSEVILLGNRPVGHSYFLSTPESKVSVPETGGTVIYCGSKCSVDGTTYEAGSAIVLPGGPTDGKTPEDLNLTTSVESKDSTMVHVFMYYDVKFLSQVTQLQAEHPDWNWVTVNN